MSIRLTLDDSLIQVAPALDDVEAVLIVQTRRLAKGAADGKVRKVTDHKGGRRVQTALPLIAGEAAGVVETRIGANNAKGQPEYETRTICRAGGVGSVFLTTTRRVKFSLRWYGDGNRYLELRIQVAPGAEIVANRGMGPFGDGGFNFLGTLQINQWAEIHYDNHTHVGLSMAIHEVGATFSKWGSPSQPPVPVSIKTRFDRVNEDE